MTFPPFLLASTCCPRIARAASSEELGTMSKNNLRRITLVRGPIWGIHSLTLIISWFKWKYHIDQVACKISKMTGIMVKARHDLSLKTLQSIYDTMVYPYLTYCNIVWKSTYQSRLKSLFMLQKKIVRIMTFAKYKEKSRPLFLSLKILSIYELNIYLMALFMYSYFSKNLPSYFDNYFKLNDTIHSHNTGTASNRYIDYKRRDYGKFSS